MPRNSFTSDPEPTSVEETTADTDGDGVIEHQGEYVSPVFTEMEQGAKVTLPMPQEEQNALHEERQAEIEAQYQAPVEEPVSEPVVEDVEIDS